ncbi:solute carrier family 7 member 13 [Sorex araneus]|uniref:solute carrier family 7 member 13 n=1 Tax=Sorex araneus TaxID=42254 RepID=UPI002433A842|nr:solute carrier family 7 member 13 [Sorex araneus]
MKTGPIDNWTCATQDLGFPTQQTQVLAAALQIQNELQEGQPPSSLTEGGKTPMYIGAFPLSGGFDQRQPFKTMQGPQLQRVIGYFHGTVFLFSIIIGAGIFISPKGVLKYSSLNVGVSLSIWAASAVVSMMAALCHAELGTTFPRSGAQYFFLKRSLGPLIAFFNVWIILFSAPAENAAFGLLLAGYIIQPFYPGCSVPALPKKCLALAILCCLGILNARGVRGITWFQTVTTAVKMMVLCCISLTGIVLLVRGRKEYLARFEKAFEGEIPDTSQIAEAFLQGLYAYGGWGVLVQIAGDLKEPSKNIPKCVITALTFVMLLYILVNVSYLAVLTPNEIISSEAVAVTWVDRVIPSMQWVISIGVSSSIFSSLSCNIFSTTRLFYVASQEGQLPLIFSSLNIHACPIAAVIQLLIFSCCIVFTSDLIVLVNYVGFASWIQLGLMMVGLLKLRFKEPNLNRPYKVRLPFIFGTIAVSLFLVLTPVIRSPQMHYIYFFLSLEPASLPLICCSLWCLNAEPQPRTQEALLRTLAPSSNSVPSFNAEELGWPQRATWMMVTG